MARQTFWSDTAAPPCLNIPALAALAQFVPVARSDGADVAPLVQKAPALAGLMALAGLRLNQPASLPLPSGVSEIPSASPSTAAPTTEQIRQAYARRELSFEANLGQTDPEVQFLSRGSGYTLYLTATEAVLHLQPPTEARARGTDFQSVLQGTDWKSVLQDSNSEPGAVVRMRLVGGNPTPLVQGREELPGKVHSYLGNDSSKWRSHVPTFGRVEYDEVYPGIDLIYYGNQQQLEYDFAVAPGTDPGAIRLAFAGVSGLEIDPQGDLLLHTSLGVVRQHKPFVYQEVAGVRHEVVSGYVLTGPEQVGFQLGAYDQARPLTIDPILAYSGYVGGPGLDLGLGITVDATLPAFRGPFAYVTGLTQSLPTTSGVVQPGYAGGDSDAFVQKIHAATGRVVWSTYLGGGNVDIGTAVAVEPDGWFVYVSGLTNSFFPDGTTGSFPTWNCAKLQCNWGGGAFDAFVVMLDWDGSNSFPYPYSSDGKSVSYSTYLGGSGMDLATGFDTQFSSGTGKPPNPDDPDPPAIIPDPFVVGTTDSPDLIPPTAPPGFQPVYGGGLTDAFVARIGPPAPLPPTWLYFSYLGGDGKDSGADIATDDTDNAYVTGTTDTPETANWPFPIVPGAFQPTYGGQDDSFVTKVEPLGTYLVYSSYLGGSNSDEGLAIDVPWQPMGGIPYAHVTGWTRSALDFPGGPGPYGGGPNDVFVTKVGFDGTALLYSKFLGGDGDEEGLGIYVPASEHIFVTGQTTSATGFPRFSPLACCPALRGPTDAFVARYNPVGSLVFSTYLGGAGRDIGWSITMDTRSDLYVNGITDSNPFPGVRGPYGGGPFDAFVSRITQ